MTTTMMTMNSSLRSWLFGPKGPILPLTVVAANRQMTTTTQTQSLEKPVNRLAPDRIADTAEKGMLVPAVYIQIRGAAMV
jgi:hypothetical protein